MLIGGDVTLNNSFVCVNYIEGGRVELGGLAAPGKIDLTIDGSIFRLGFSNDSLRANVVLKNDSSVDVTTGGGGSIAINAQNLTLQNSSLLAGIKGGYGTPASKAGNIDIDIIGTISMTGNSRISNQVFEKNVGNSGDVNIRTQKLIVSDSSQISAITFAQGNAGNLTIHADAIKLQGSSNYPAGLFTEVKGEGHGGNLAITTRDLSISDGARVSAISFGKGDAGDVTIDASASIEVVGSSPDAYFLSKITTDVGQSGVGNSGNLTINTPRLFVRDGGQISAMTFGQGNAGILTVNADFIGLYGVSPDNSQNGYYPAGLFTEVKGEGRGGQLKVSTNHLSIIDGARISAITFGKGDAGNVSINASEIVEVIGTSSDLVFSSKIVTDVGEGATGNSGNLTITAPQLIVGNGAQISSSTFGKGNAGNLTVHAANSVELSGESGRDGDPGGLFAQVNESGVGHGGNLFLETERLSVSNGSKVQVATFGDGNAGNLLIRAAVIDLFNTPNANNFFSTAINAGVTRDPRFIRKPTGNGGDLTIETERLSIRDGAEVTVDTAGQGNAGRLVVQAKDLVEVVGQNSFLTADVNSGATGRGGSLTIKSKRLSIKDGGQVGSSTFGIGNAGDVFVYAADIDILGASANGNPSGLFSTSSQNARGNGGNLFVDAENLNLSNSGRLSAQSRGAGTAGNIIVNARNIRMRSNSGILTISNSGDGGNITLNAKTIVALENSDILAFAPVGRGGNINFNTRAFLSDPLYRPSPSITDRAALNALLTNSRVDVNASGTVSGTVNGVPDTTFLQNGLTQLSDNLIDPNALLANSCIVRNRQQNGRFYITGSGGLPLRPGDAPLSSFPTGDVRNVATDETDETDKPLPASVSSASHPLPRSWKIGDPIVEPQGIYRLSNGKLVLSRECEQ